MLIIIPGNRILMKTEGLKTYKSCNGNHRCRCWLEWPYQNSIIKKDEITIEITIGENYIKVNGNEVKNDTVAVINNNRTYC